MFFQDAPPDTSGYMIAGYVIAFLVMGLYIASIYWRNRNLKQDIAMLEEMEAAASAPIEKKKPAKPSTQAKPKPVTKKVRN